MKTIILISSLLVISASSFATVSFTNSTGDLVMRDVSVDGTTNYDSVQLQMDFANGTFSILDATLDSSDNNPFSDTALDSLTENTVQVDFHGCALSNVNQVTCMIKLAGLNSNVNVLAAGNAPSFSKLFDNLGNEYDVSTIIALNKTSTITELDTTGPSLQFRTFRGIPVEVKYIYNSIDPAATSFSAFQPQRLR